MTALPPHTSEGYAALRTLPDRRSYAGVPDVGCVRGIANDGDAPDVKLSPRGEPWLKCCEECAIKDRRQIKPIETAARGRNAAFYCVHREDVDGRYRVCAGFAARDAGRLRKETRDDPR